MRNWKDILFKILWGLLGVAVIVLFVFAWQSKTEKKCIGIEVELVGENHTALFMDEHQVLSILQSKQIKVGTPISSIPLGSLENEFKQIAWIKNANFYFDNQNKLQVKIEQRIPIARIFTQSGNSFYMDAEGRRLPLKQLSVLELPIFTGFTSDAEKLSTPDSTLLNEVLTFSKIIQQDSFFNAQIAQININPSGQFELVPLIGDQIVLIGSTSHLKDKLNRLYTFYKKVLVPSGINAYQYIDCRFDNQVVALKKGVQPIEFGNNVINLNPGSKLSDTTQPLAVTNMVPKVDSLKKDTTKLPAKAPKPVVQIVNKPLIVKKAVAEKGKILDKKNAKKIPKALNNKNNKASLNIKKKSAKAVMPKVGASKTTTNN
jgi:cell division protein FtsQ